MDNDSIMGESTLQLKRERDDLRTKLDIAHINTMHVIKERDEAQQLLREVVDNHDTDLAYFMPQQLVDRIRACLGEDDV